MSRNRNPSRPQPPIAPKPRSFAANAASFWSILIAIGAAGGFFSLIEKGWTFALTNTRPDIRALNLSPDPFTLPFVIKNQSSVFSMIDATWTCGVDTIGNPQTGGLSNLGISYGKPTTILPGQTLLVRCPVANAANSDATIIPIIKYKTVWFSREYSDNTFTWLSKANPPQWIDGRPLK